MKSVYGRYGGMKYAENTNEESGFDLWAIMKFAKRMD